jgi:nifR3 family TIM-barrel protein
MRAIREPWTLGGLTIPNRVVLAPLAGIGNWFVRLQAKRYGAGLAVSEMVSSFAVHYGNRKTLDELLVIHPDERAGGPVSVQLFGHDPEIMRSAAATVARAGADLIDLNMGCPVPKVCKTGAGAALLGDPDTAIAVARAAREGSGLPVTVKLRAGRKPGEREGVEVAHRLVDEAGVAGISFHPRSAAVRHKGTPDYDLAAELVAALPVPVIVSGGLDAPGHIRWVLEHTGAAAVMLARGSLGNPWLFDQLLGDHEREPTRAEVLDELDWVVDRAEEHLGPERAARYLRKFHPWYLARLGEPASTQADLQRAEGLEQQREILGGLRYHAAPLATRAA